MDSSSLIRSINDFLSCLSHISDADILGGINLGAKENSMEK